MNTTPSSTSPLVTWDELLESISTGASHPDDTNWKIFRYLQSNYKTMGSQMARTLLAAYMKLHVKRESLINSCMLGMALKISETYSDFKLPNFLKAWGYDSCLRAEDMRRQTGKNGRQYLSLKERVDRALQSYMLHHPEEGNGECEGVVSMYAVKVFDKETNGRKRRFVRLVAKNGTDFIADSHQFPCRPWEICGRMFDVLTRVSLQGNERVSDIVVSKHRVDDVFSVEVGFVDFIDELHGHIHVFDSQSRHFVADKAAHPSLSVAVDSYVRFCPIIVNGEHFKSAAIVATVDKYDGRKAFGIYEARVDYANHDDQYIRYTIHSPIRQTPEGVISQSGFASTATLSEDDRRSIVLGSHVRLVLFLKRGKDGMKRNYVAEIF